MRLVLKIGKMKIKFILIIILLTGCGSFNEAGKALRNEKIKTTDEFLIEKRGPLTLPPDMEKLPKPKSEIKAKKNKNVLGAKESSKEIPNESSRLEKILLEEIKDN